MSAAPAPPCELTFACPTCGTRPVVAPLMPTTRRLLCPAGHATDLADVAALLAARPLGPCVVCGSADLYAQRDFNRPLGLTLAAVGLALGPFTRWISTVAAIGLDAALYLVTPTVCICYACNAQYRGVGKDRWPPAFEIAVHDAYKFGKRFPPRRGLAVAGPYLARLRAETPR